MKAHYLLPNQLFESHSFDISTIILHEHSRYFLDFKFHKQKLMFHRASMKTYEKHLKDQGKKVIYIEFNESLIDVIRKYSIDTLYSYDPVDNSIAREFIQLKDTLNIIVHDSPLFLLTADESQEFLGESTHYSMNSFYIKQRKYFDILMSKGKPVGDKYSYDQENRKKISKEIIIPEPWVPKENDYVRQAREYVNKHFASNPGSDQTFIYPITHKEAKKWFDHFLTNRFDKFGIYQDAIVEYNPFLFHSLLSPLLNTGLLNVHEVVNQSLKYAKSHHVPLNSLEGFLRQIIGWREFVRGVYIAIGEDQRNSNFFNHDRPLSKQFWEFKTDIVPLDDALNSVHEFSYAHHIQRLMIFGNFMLLCQTKPNDVYTWFMEMFIDAYDWVMVPNVYGMSQYSDGGRIITKPYISSSNYILKMSNYKRGPWCKLWDALYWNFIIRNFSMLQKNPRLAMIASSARRMSKDTLSSHISLAEKYINFT